MLGSQIVVQDLSSKTSVTINLDLLANDHHAWAWCFRTEERQRGPGSSLEYPTSSQSVVCKSSSEFPLAHCSHGGLREGTEYRGMERLGKGSIYIVIGVCWGQTFQGGHVKITSNTACDLTHCSVREPNKLADSPE